MKNKKRRFVVYNGGQQVNPIIFCGDTDDGRHTVICLAIPGFRIVADDPITAHLYAQMHYINHIDNARFN